MARAGFSYGVASDVLEPVEAAGGTLLTPLNVLGTPIKPCSTSR